MLRFLKKCPEALRHWLFLRAARFCDDIEVSPSNVDLLSQRERHVALSSIVGDPNLSGQISDETTSRKPASKLLITKSEF
jgi:hypothetical protein